VGLAVPRHVAIIMDGNGRWAAARRLPRVAGHRAGAQAVRRTIEAAIRNGVEWLTLFAFSSENWRRPEDEITDLTGLLRHYLRTEVAELHRERVRLRSIGDRSRFGPDIALELEQAETLTRNNTRLNLNVALSGGGRPAGPRCGDRGNVQHLSVHRRHAGPGPGDPHQRRAPGVQFPALAICLRRIPVS
jgi:undecaprenyl diphosphate synthase